MLFRIREPGAENSIRKAFQKHYFGNTEGLEEHCRKNLTLNFCSADNTNNTSNDEVVEKFLDYANTSNGRVAQTLIDILLLEKQVPFPVLFELHRLKHGNGDDVSLLEALIQLVKNCFEIEVGKLTPLNADPCKCKYKPENLPKYLLEVVHSLCIPPTRSDEYCGLVLKQIKTATELEKDGVSFKKNNGEHTLFDIHFKEGMMKIRGFRIDEFTETFLRSMIAYEKHPDVASKPFTDFVLFMTKLINTPKDAELLCGIIGNFHGTNREQLFSELLGGSTFSGVMKKQEVPEENQTHNIGKYISRVPEVLSETNPSAYKAKLISIGPYYRIREPGSENSIKKHFQKGFFGSTVGLEEQCREKLTSFVDQARSCYTDSTKDMSNVGFVEMLMIDGCFILQFLKSVKDKKSSDNGIEAQTFMEKERNVVQTLKDMLLFENQIPFYVLFELHKLKLDKGDDVALLMDLIELVKNCYESQVRKLTQPRLPCCCKYNPEKLPKHLLEVVHSLCVPTRSDEGCTGLVSQINTATELEKYGVSFKKRGEATNDKEKFFSQLLVGVDTSSTSTLSTLSGVINKVMLHCDSPPEMWMGKLIQDLINSPWTPIIGIGAAIAMIVGIVFGIVHVITSV
nr:putative UPF0481 protein At3g02645 isoform X2 [Ipomoea batatas]